MAHGPLSCEGAKTITCHCHSSSTQTCRRCSHFHTRSRVYCEGIHGPEEKKIVNLNIHLNIMSSSALVWFKCTHGLIQSTIFDLSIHFSPMFSGKSKQKPKIFHLAFINITFLWLCGLPHLYDATICERSSLTSMVACHFLKGSYVCVLCLCIIFVFLFSTISWHLITGLKKIFLHKDLKISN